MSKRFVGTLTGLMILSVSCFITPASALTMKQCSEKYRAATKSGAVAGMNWTEFRKSECGRGATMAVKNAKAPSSAATGPSLEECSVRYRAAKDAGTLGGMTWNEFRSAGCVAKTAAAPTPPAKQETARMPAPGEKTAEKAAAPKEKMKVSEKECSTRYQAAKTAGTLAGMTWNEFRSAGCPESVAQRGGSMTPTAGSVFPNSISRKYAGDHAGRARLLTCRDQYRANKAAGISQPRWTEEGGGYYSECNKRLSQ